MKTQVIYAANKNKDADFDLQAGDFGRKRKKSPACRSKSEESGRNHPLAGQNRKKAEEITKSEESGRNHPLAGQNRKKAEEKIGRKRKKSPQAET
jgi:hypothetical protein